MSLKVWLPLTGSLENKGTKKIGITSVDMTVDSDGKIGSCYNFNGTSSYLQLNNFWPSGWPEFSVACWCYPIGGFGSLLLLRGDGNSHRFRIYATTYGFRDTNHSDFVSVGTSTEIPSNVWSHICAIYNRGELSFYVNGVLVNHTTEYYNETSTLISDTKQEFYIGMNKTSSSESYYSGKINDFRVYDHALSTAEVKEIAKGLVCHYKLDRSDKICDSSGYGNHAISVGSLNVDTDTPRYRSCIVLDGSTAAINCGRRFDVQGAEEATFTGWFYISNWQQERSSYFISSQQTGGILLCVISGTTIRARAHVYTAADKSAYEYQQADYDFTTEDIPTGAGWHMLTGVYSTSGIKVYLDGALKNIAESTTYGIHFNMNANMFIGAESNGKNPSGFAECKASDVRLYYTALSDQDILDLYQTGVKIDKSGQIHAGELYECDAQAIRKTGVLESKNFSEFCPSLKYDRKVYVEPDGSKWVHIAHHNNPIESGLFSENDTFSKGVYLDEDRWYDVEQTVSQLNVFEFMHKQKQYNTDNEVKYRWIQTANPLTAVYSDVTLDKVTRIVTNGYTDGGYGGLYIKGGNAHLSIADDVASHWYGAYGSWTSSSSGRIPGYSPLYIYSGYMDLYVRIDNQDLNVGAGFYRNGTINGNNLIEV